MKALFVIFAVSSIVVTYCLNNHMTIPKNNQLESDDMTIKCVNRIIKHLYCSGNFILLSGKLAGIGFPSVNFDARQPFITFNTAKFDIAVIQLEEKEELSRIINKISIEYFFNPTAKFLVISTSVSSNFLQVSSDFYLKNVLFIETTTNSIYGLVLFQNQNSSFVPKNFKYLANCNENLSSLNLFKTLKNPTTWKNTTLNVMYNVLPPYVQTPISEKSGIEIRLLEIISKHLDFKVHYIGDQDFKYWGSHVNGSYTHILQKLFQRKVDMVLGAFHSKFEEHLDFDMTFSFIQDGLFWVVPRARKFTGWRKLALVLSLETYILILLSLIIIPVICRILYREQVLDYFLLLYQTLLEVGLPHLPRRRIVYSYILLPYLIVSTVFKGSLIHILSIEHYLHQIKTLEDIVQSNLTIIFDHDIAKYFKNNNSWDKHVYERYEYCESPRKCINRTAFEKNVVTVDFQMAYEFQLPLLYVSPEGKPLLYLFHTPIFPLFIHWYFVKGFPLFPQIDEILLRLKSSGIIDHICQTVSMKAKMDLSRKVGISSNILGLREMYSSFILLVLGYILSLAIFFVEICLSCGKKKSGAIKNV